MRPIKAPLASLAAQRCFNLGGLGPRPAEVIKPRLPPRLPSQLQWHVKSLLASCRSRPRLGGSSSRSGSAAVPREAAGAGLGSLRCFPGRGPAAGCHHPAVGVLLVGSGKHGVTEQRSRRLLPLFTPLLLPANEAKQKETQCSAGASPLAKTSPGSQKWGSQTPNPKEGDHQHYPLSSDLRKPPGTRIREEATALRRGWRSPEFPKHRDTKPRVQRVSKHPGKPGPRPQGSTGCCSAPPSPAEPSTSQHGLQLAPIWGHGREQPREGGRLQPRMLRRGTNPTSTCSATAEAADVMKKTIHEEIITLQNYFKSMRAKMYWGGRLGTGCCHSRSPATSATPPAPAGQGDPKPSCTRGCVDPEGNAPEQQNVAPKRHLLAYGAAALVAGCVLCRICQTWGWGGCNFCLRHLAELILLQGCGL